MTDDIPAVCLLEDLARVLKMSRRTIERRRAARTFPIRELPALDKRPRWSRQDVLKFLANERTRRSA